MVIAAGYALPLTADINGVIPLASLVNKFVKLLPNKSKNAELVDTLESYEIGQLKPI